MAEMGIVTPGAANLGLFLSAALIFFAIPGPAVLYIVGRSIAQGRRAGLVSVAGIHAASLVHIFAAVVGLSAALASSAFAFAAVKYAGAAYLIALGLQKLFTRTHATAPVLFDRRGHARLFRDGFIVNLLNPKTALFFLAFLPQFVDLSRGHIAMQIAVLGALYALLGLVSDSIYALAAGAAGEWLRRSSAWIAAERYLSGLLMIGLGMMAAFAGDHRK